jgi:hypothetical protein
LPNQGHLSHNVVARGDGFAGGHATTLSICRIPCQSENTILLVQPVEGAQIIAQSFSERLMRLLKKLDYESVSLK